ncbi:hypothetical protein M8J75_001704 [Diaphorina citri]|nr:hypothetical protein M8J75_001704 [Diaphorina citri]
MDTETESLKMGRRKQKSSDSISAQCNGDSSESGRSRDPSQAPEKKSCIHINKAVDQNEVRKHFKNPSADFFKCGQCDSQDIWVCLRCGVSVCAPEHAQKHSMQPLDLHCMMLDTTKWTVWCYKCNSGVQVNASKKLRTLVDHVQGHFDKAPRTLPVISTVAIPLGPPPPPLPIDKKQETSTNNSRNFKKKGTNGKQTVTPQPCKIRGLANLGNTCFFNSVLQCLAQTPKLVELMNEMKDGGEEFTMPSIDESESEPSKTKGKLDGWGPLTEQLAKTLGELNSGGNTVYSPRPLLEELRKKCPQFRGYEQHDAHELLRELLYAVRTEDIKRYRKEILLKVFKTTKINPKDMNDEEKAKAKRLDQKISDMVTTKPIDVFQGKTECVHECQDCQHRTRKIEPFMDLSLPVLSEKKNREDSTSEEPTLSKHQLKKLNKQKRKGAKGKKGQRGNASNNSNNANVSRENEDENNEQESLAPNSDKSNENPSSDSEENNSSPVHPRRQESGYNSDKAHSPALMHTAQAFMDTYSLYNLNLPGPLQFRSKASSMSSLDDDTAKPLDQHLINPIDQQDPLEPSALDQQHSPVDLSPEASVLDQHLINPLDQQHSPGNHLSQSLGKEHLPKSLDQEHLPNSLDVEHPPPDELPSVSCPLLDFDLVGVPTTSPNEPASPSHIYNQSGEPSGSIFDPWPPGPPELTMESLKQNTDLTDVCSRSSSQFHESGFGSHCSQSIDEVSSTHPSEGMCSTESCNGGPSLYGDEFQHVENKTSIPESGIGSMTEELAAMSIMESDGEANASPDSMQANRSSGSMHTLSPYSDDSSQKKNVLRSCNSLSNLSGEDLSCFLNANQPCFDHDYISEKLRASRPDNTEAEDEEEEKEREEDEEEGAVGNGKEEVQEEEEAEEEKSDNEEFEESSVGNGKTLSPRPPRHEGECSLLSCLNQYTCIELLAGNNKVTCEMCTKKHNRGTNKTEPVKTAATLQTLIVSPPSVLICHLKRFQLTYSSLKKITKSVPFPMKLSIGSFCSSKCQGIEKGQTDVQYSLYGIVEHSGSLHGGHYVAYVKTSSGQWYYASDSRVNPVSEDRVLKAEAYLLFYHRIC